MTIAKLPSLPNPASHRHPASAEESLRILRTLGEGASNGTVDYPYPTTHDYPLPPLPPIPVPPGIRRRGVEPTKRAEEPIQPPPVVDASPLSKAVEGRGTLHFDDSALLIPHPKGWTWVLLSRRASRADEVRVLGVRYFPTREKRPPPIHVLPSAGLGQAVSDHLARLRLTLPSFLERHSVVLGLLDHPCYRCGKYLNPASGLPLCTGWLRKEKEREKEKSKKTGSDEDKENENKEKESETKETEKEKEDSSMDVDGDKTNDEDGRWVAWHESCRVY